MKRRLTSHFFWGSQSPLAALGCVGLIIMASSRFSFALICSSALIWMFGLTTLIYTCAQRFMPSRGKWVILLFLSTFLCGFFALLVSFLNPLLAMGTIFFIVLIPPWSLSSGFFEALESTEPMEAVIRALIEAITMAGVILALSLIREPLGMGTISFPGGPEGIVELFGGRDADAFVPARILSVSAGGLLLLGYITALYRYFREQNDGPERLS